MKGTDIISYLRSKYIIRRKPYIISRKRYIIHPPTGRDSIIIEEIVNMLGLTDPELREDSIVYQYSNGNHALSDVDRVILELLYSDGIVSGMPREECGAVIRELYY